MLYLLLLLISIQLFVLCLERSSKWQLVLGLMTYREWLSESLVGGLLSQFQCIARQQEAGTPYNCTPHQMTCSNITYHSRDVPTAVTSLLVSLLALQPFINFTVFFTLIVAVLTIQNSIVVPYFRNDFYPGEKIAILNDLYSVNDFFLFYNCHLLSQ